MPIDFLAERNRYTYASRSADSSWFNAVSSLAAPHGKTLLDIGCGGGIYLQAWRQLGAKRVIGVDFSEQMVRTAFERTREMDDAWVLAGRATSVPLPSGTVDIVFTRALIHHLSDHDFPIFLAEAHRLLAPGGVCIIQGRTFDDVACLASPTHIRGFLFEAFPKLLQVEEARRRGSREVVEGLLGAGFANVRARSFWEVRREYEDVVELAQDLRGRVGRSILHELTDEELQYLVEYITARLAGRQHIVERDRWTLWHAQKPASARMVA